MEEQVISQVLLDQDIENQDHMAISVSTITVKIPPLPELFQVHIHQKLYL